MNSEFDGILPQADCPPWHPALPWLHFSSDWLIALSCLAIAVSLAYRLRRHEDTPGSTALKLSLPFITLAGIGDLLDSTPALCQKDWLTIWIKPLTAITAMAAAVAVGRLQRHAAGNDPPADALPASEQLNLYQQIFEANDEALVIVDADHRVERVNEAYSAITGYSVAEVTGSPVRLFEPQLNAVGLADGLWKEVRHTGRWSGEVVDRRKNGEVYPKWLQVSLMGTGQESRPRYAAWFSDLTERKTTEAALIQSEERWKFALEVAGDGVWDYNFLTDETVYSKRYREMNGLTDGEQYDWKSLVHPDDLNHVMFVLKAYLDGDIASFSAEYRMRCKDGGWKWVLDRGMLISRTEDGRPLRMIGTHSDITARKELQMNQVVTILESSPEATLLIAEDGSIQFANRISSDVFGYSQEELPTLTLGDLMSIDDRTVDSNEGRLMCMQGTRRDGSQFPVQVCLHPIQLNRQPYTITTVVDVTERQRMEREMQLAGMVYQAIGEAIMVADANNRIIAVNPAFCRLTGYEESEVVGQTTSLLRSGLHSEEFYRDMWESLNRTGHWQGEINNRRKNGDIYLEWLAISNIYGEGGNVLRRVAMFSDITEQKRAEQTIWKQANFDPLTGLPNRRLFMDRLERGIKESRRNRSSMGLLFIDLDGFKEVNDTLGHDAGDQLLQETARRLQLCVRESDTVARLGGDEFTVVLSGLDSINDVGRVAQSVLESLSKPFVLGHEAARISASIGITLYPGKGADSEELIRQADQAMYAAKQRGRNQYSYFTAAKSDLTTVAS
jgi:diguanylate cyclase (GGDEF)-like protein/PAS domain S-box-containing protein